MQINVNAHKWSHILLKFACLATTKNPVANELFYMVKVMVVLIIIIKTLVNYISEQWKIILKHFNLIVNLNMY